MNPLARQPMPKEPFNKARYAGVRAMLSTRALIAWPRAFQVVRPRRDQAPAQHGCLHCSVAPTRDREHLFGRRDVVPVRALLGEDRHTKAVVEFFRSRGVGVAPAHVVSKLDAAGL